MKTIYTFLFSILFTSVFAQSANVLKDINPGGSNADAFDEYHNHLLATDNYIYFFADDGIHGVELWRTDGTAEGTHLIKDVNPGPADGYYSLVSDIEGLIFEVGNQILFLSDDGVHGLELWSTDGTESGTSMVKDINEGSANGIGISTAYGAIVYNDELYFPGNEDAYGTELWKSDGTPEGTVLVKNIRYEGASSRPNDFLIFNDLLYFQADEGWIQGGLGVELYVTDGTEAGTNRVTDINPGSTSADPRELIHAGDFFYFIADVGAGTSLWKSDGTPGGTTMVKDGFYAIYDDRMAAHENQLYFAADDDISGTELWTSDGTAAGTFLLKDIEEGSGGSWPKQLTIMNGHLYCVADTDVEGDRIWTSDGTVEGTQLFSTDYGNYMTAFQNQLIYNGPNPSSFGQVLMYNDGTAAGTGIVDVPNGVELNKPSQYTAFKGKLYFVAFDYEYGREMWVYTPAETTTTSTREVLSQNNFEVNPNPATSYLQIKTKVAGEKQIQIFNGLGQIVFQQLNQSGTAINIDIADFENGMYFIEVLNEFGEKSSQTFIKVK